MHIRASGMPIQHVKQLTAIIAGYDYRNILKVYCFAYMIPTAPHLSQVMPYHSQPTYNHSGFLLLLSGPYLFKVSNDALNSP